MKMLTKHGLFVDPWFVRPEDVSIHDIAHSLSRQVRFTGHSEVNVAFHSVQVARYLEWTGEDKDTQSLGLMHDAPETWLHDIAWAVKRNPMFDVTKEYAYAHYVAMNSVMQAFGLKETPESWALVHHADMVIGACEAWYNWPLHHAELEAEYPGTAALVEQKFLVRPKSPDDSQTLFIQWCQHLGTI